MRMRNVLFAFGFAALLLLAGCAQEEPAAPVQPEPEQPMPGSDRDEHGCIPSAGYSWCESKQMCIRPWETVCPLLSEAQARAIAETSECMEEGGLTGQAMYNENSKTWWFDMDVEKPGCAPACVVSEEGRTAEINWRCTGLLLPDESLACSYSGHGSSMALRDAYSIAEAAGSVCMVEGTLDRSDAMCNENSGTWWIGLVPKVERAGCSPACVVNVNSRTAEVNWRCTGLSAEAKPPINEGGGACMFRANGKAISFARAREVASREISPCASMGTLNMAKYLCNSETGKMYFEITPFLPNQGCTPHCAVNVNSETARVEWQCGEGFSAE